MLIHVGVDQTGALRKRGGKQIPAPLPAAFFIEHSGGRELQLKWLDSLSLPELRRAAEECLLSAGPDEAEEAGGPLSYRFLILLDCVFGLAEECFPNPRGPSRFGKEFFRLADAEEGYGRAVAERFFASLRPDAGDEGGESARRPPIREIERLTGANSVFLTRPFQRNIQTGTFRIWKDLGRSLRDEGDWFGLWPFESVAEPGGRQGEPCAWIAEGYPSLVWRKLFGLSKRDPETLAKVLHSLSRKNKLRISSADLQTIRESQDHADATVLALHAAKGHADEGLSPDTQRSVIPALGRRRMQLLLTEGWIYGYPFR